jgi:cleavage and polyadenylation specificity factor subunit 3
MASKRKASAMANAASEEPVDPADELKFLCLGGGNEVGRSCHIIQYKGKTVMVSIFHRAASLKYCPVMLNCAAA